MPLSLSTAPKTFTRVTKAILLQCQECGKTVFLYLDDALVLANSYTQAKEDGQIVVELLQTGISAEPRKVQAGAQSRIYTSGCGVQHTGYDDM